MKKSKKIIAAVLVLAILAGVFQGVTASRRDEPVYGASEQWTVTQKRAVWISMMDFEKYLRSKSEKQFRRGFLDMCRKAKANQLNTLIVHVRPFADALYPSKYFPWSYCINAQGKDPGYDPLAIMVEVAHKQHLKIEAWVNPYRISTNTQTTKSIRKTRWYKEKKDDIIQYNANGGKCLAFDPGKSKARELIVNGVKEIVKNYDVDGIHMDDYFYVSGMKDRLSISKKKANVNKLVKSLYKEIKKIDRNCEFGISPAGNLDNARAQGADIDRWLKTTGYVDYLMPQIYWSDVYILGNKKVKMFTDRAKLWAGLERNENVKLYVGLALYRAKTEIAEDKRWKSASDNLKKQYVLSKKLGYEGYSLFTYADLERKTAQKELKNLKKAVSCSEQAESLADESVRT